MTKITPIFDKNGKKIPFFRARSARGGGPPRHPPNRPAKIYRQKQPTPIFGIPLPIIHPPLLEFHYLQIASNYGIPLFIDRLHFWNSTIYRSPPLLEFHYLHIASTFGIPLFVYRLQLWNSNYRPYYNHCKQYNLSLTLQNPPYF